MIMIIIIIILTQRKDLVALLPVNAIPTNIPVWYGQ